MTKRSNNRALPQENTIEKINLVMTPKSDDFPIVTILAWSRKCRYTESHCSIYFTFLFFSFLIFSLFFPFLILFLLSTLAVSRSILNGHIFKNSVLEPIFDFSVQTGSRFPVS